MELIDKKLEIIRLYSLLINEYSKYIEKNYSLQIILYKNAFKNESESNLIIRKQNYKLKQ